MSNDLGTPLKLEDIKEGISFTVINTSVWFPIHCGVFKSRPYEDGQSGQMLVNATNAGTQGGYTFPELLSGMGLWPDISGHTATHIKTYRHPDSCTCSMGQQG